uniref:Uncharacterized protein n=1 Tax=Amphimedon queenslandica TaxID=400682 RepID=A0A1X7VQN6_AMPQE
MAVSLGKAEELIVCQDRVELVQEEVIADPDSGIVMNVKKTKVAKDVGGGRIAVQEKIELEGIKVDTGKSQSNSSKAITNRQAQSRRAAPVPPTIVIIDASPTRNPPKKPAAITSRPSATKNNNQLTSGSTSSLTSRPKTSPQSNPSSTTVNQRYSQPATNMLIKNNINDSDEASHSNKQKNKSKQQSCTVM